MRGGPRRRARRTGVGSRSRSISMAAPCAPLASRSAVSPLFPGVRPKPKRSCTAGLHGRAVNQHTSAAAVAFADAKGHGHNDFKIELGKRTMIRALQQAGRLEI